MTTGADIVADARRYLGVRYKVNGRDRDGFDCVGLIVIVGNDFGLNWQRDTPELDPRAGVDWQNVNTELREFGFKEIPLGEQQIGDVMVHRLPLGGAATIKIVSGLGGLSSFFGVSKFINFREPTFLEESGLTLADMIDIKRELKMNMQDYVRRLWRFFRFPFVQS